MVEDATGIAHILLKLKSEMGQEAELAMQLQASAPLTDSIPPTRAPPKTF